MFQLIDTYLSGRSKPFLIGFSAMFVLIMGSIDHLTGSQISFSVFYIFPILLATWYVNKSTGMYISTLAAIVWLIADLTTGYVYRYFLIPYWNACVRLTFFLVITILTSLIKSKLAQEEALADTDYLTGLKNSRSFYEHVASEAVRSQRYGRPFTMAYVDLDNFKFINDTMGHDTGDEVLRSVAAIIKDNLRQSDVSSRLGGDEFAVLFPETNYHAAEAIINNLVPLLSGSMTSNNWPVSFSIGAVSFVTPMSTVRQMIKTVDDVMYEVKKSGKNNIIHREWRPR